MERLVLGCIEAANAAKPLGLRDGISSSCVAQPLNVPLVVAPDDKVSTVQKCTNISQEVVPVRADNSVDRICKAKPSSNTDHLRSQARNCSLLDTDLRSSGTSFTDNVQDRSSREETDFRNSSLL